MKYNQLGRSGLKISQLSLGSWLTFGVKLDIGAVRAMMQYACDKGVNFFDNAEVYANGQSEIIMGEALQLFRREELVISTKIFWSGDKPNDVGLSRKHLFEGTARALKRLNLEYVDLLYCHRPDPQTPIIETVRAMSDLVQQGYAFYWGTSEWSAEEIAAAHQAAEKINAIPPTMEQPEYNLFHRNRVEQEYLPLYEKYGMGTTTWAPLAFGVLTGKYTDQIPADSRLALSPEWRRPDFEQRIKKTQLLKPIADELNCSLGQLAIAWCLKNKYVSSVILGSSNLVQLKENLNSLIVVDKLSTEVLAIIDQVLCAGD